MRRLLIFLSFFIFAGSLGLKYSTEQCYEPAPDGHALRRSELMQCYHLVAVTSAYIYPGNPDRAISTCGQIFSNFGGTDVNDDLNRKAELEANNCYLDVARITGDSSACLYISKHLVDTSGLFGEAVTQDMCVEQANKAASMRPGHYYSDPNSLCSIIFILPLVSAVLLCKN